MTRALCHLTSSTLEAVLAEVSMNMRPCSLANASPSSFFTSLLDSRSLQPHKHRRSEASLHSNRLTAGTQRKITSQFFLEDCCYFPCISPLRNQARRARTAVHKLRSFANFLINSKSKHLGLTQAIVMQPAKNLWTAGTGLSVRASQT